MNNSSREADLCRPTTHGLQSSFIGLIRIDMDKDGCFTTNPRNSHGATRCTFNSWSMKTESTQSISASDNDSSQVVGYTQSLHPKVGDETLQRWALPCSEWQMKLDQARF